MNSCRRPVFELDIHSHITSAPNSWGPAIITPLVSARPTEFWRLAYKWAICRDDLDSGQLAAQIVEVGVAARGESFGHVRAEHR
jgi:hypothetical protein